MKKKSEAFYAYNVICTIFLHIWKYFAYFSCSKYKSILRSYILRQVIWKSSFWKWAVELKCFCTNMENELVVKTRGKKVVITGLYKIMCVKILKTVKHYIIQRIFHSIKSTEKSSSNKNLCFPKYKILLVRFRNLIYENKCNSWTNLHPPQKVQPNYRDSVSTYLHTKKN